MKISRLSVVLFTTALSAALVQAEETIKPGLWEVTVKAGVNGQQLPDMQEMLAKVPPEMREQVKAMMAKKGNSMTDAGAMRVCLTAEQIASNEYGADPKGHCKATDIQKQGNKTTVKLLCDKPKGEGVTELTIRNEKSWQSVTHMTMEEHGKQQQVSSESSAEWVSADCGDVQPKSGIEQKSSD